MKTLPALLSCGLLAVCALFPVGTAQAQTCTVSATATAFGNLNPMSATAVDSLGQVTMTCVAHPLALSLGHTISLSSGGAGSFANRRMSSGAHHLRYQLYRDILRTTVWGDGSAGTATQGGGLTLSLLFPVSIVYPVYGRVPGSQTTVPSGSYSDALTVTVTY